MEMTSTISPILQLSNSQLALSFILFLAFLLFCQFNQKPFQLTRKDGIRQSSQNTQKTQVKQVLISVFSSECSVVFYSTAGGIS